jgi:ketopantoate reductase
MRIGVFGAGAVGGYFGGRLAAAGEDVHFIAAPIATRSWRPGSGSRARTAI